MEIWENLAELWEFLRELGKKWDIFMEILEFERLWKNFEREMREFRNLRGFSRNFKRKMNIFPRHKPFLDILFKVGSCGSYLCYFHQKFLASFNLKKNLKKAKLKFYYFSFIFTMQTKKNLRNSNIKNVYFIFGVREYLRVRRK